MRKGMILAVALTGLAGVALAHTGVKDKVVMKRMELMKSIGENTKTLGQMAKGKKPFDAEAARRAALEIANYAKTMPDHFEVKAEDPKDEAKPVIWDQFDDFTAKSLALEATARRFAGSVEAKADLPGGLRDIGAACKACHEVYKE